LTIAIFEKYLLHLEKKEIIRNASINIPLKIIALYAISQKFTTNNH
jgi:hypothetical protein